MPKGVACNGFSMFANHIKAKLEANRGGRKFTGGMEELIQAANPHWKALPESERLHWKTISKQYKKTEEYTERKRATKYAPRNRVPVPKRIKDEPEELSDGEWLSDHDDPGVPMVRTNPKASAYGITIRPSDDLQNNMIRSVGQAVLGVGTRQNSYYEDQPKLKDDTFMIRNRSEMDQKKFQDKKKLFEFFSAECGGRLIDVKRCRFLMASVQTYGNLEQGICVPAELAIIEWSLHSGIMDEYHAIVGPWEIEDPYTKERAVLHSRNSHRIPMEGPQGYTALKRTVLREILGRCEPGIAANQGVKVGLYKEGLEEVDGVPVGGQPESKMREMMNESNEEDLDNKIWPLLPADVHGRRWVICLESEYAGMMNGIRFLRDQENIDYDGFPTTSDRFMFLDTVVEALSEFVQCTVPPKFLMVASALQNPGNKQRYKTPWDGRSDILCAYHRKDPVATQDWCALAAARKACLAGFHALREGFGLPIQDELEDE